MLAPRLVTRFTARGAAIAYPSWNITGMSVMAGSQKGTCFCSTADVQFVLDSASA